MGVGAIGGDAVFTDMDLAAGRGEGVGGFGIVLEDVVGIVGARVGTRE